MFHPVLATAVSTIHCCHVKFPSRHLTIGYGALSFSITHTHQLRTICSSLFQYSLKFPGKNTFQNKRIFTFSITHLANYLACVWNDVRACVRTRQTFPFAFYMMCECVCVSLFFQWICKMQTFFSQTQCNRDLYCSKCTRCREYCGVLHCMLNLISFQRID